MQFKQLLKAIYNFLVEERWNIAERLSSYSKTCKVSGTSNRFFLDINYCQSLKWQGKEKELKEELKKFDISSLSPIYIGLSAFKSDKETFYSTIKKAIITDKVEENMFSEWPLFKELREDPDYKKRIEAAFKNVSS